MKANLYKSISFFLLAFTFLQAPVEGISFKKVGKNVGKALDKTVEKVGKAVKKTTEQVKKDWNDKKDNSKKKSS